MMRLRMCPHNDTDDDDDDDTGGEEEDASCTALPLCAAAPR